jgi:hypothetical protein
MNAPDSNAPPPSAARDRQWFILSRWQEYEAEARANLLRIVGIGAFYAIEMINHGVQLGPLQLPPVVSDRFHQSITGLAVAWTMLALATHLCLRRRYFPPALKFVTTACDLVLLTAVLMVADGPRSPLAVVYFLILALAALRLRVPLVWLATVGAMGSYLFLLGYVKYFVDAERAATMTVPRYYQLIMLAALAITGVTLGQLIRRVRTLAEEFARRVAEREPSEGASS